MISYYTAIVETEAEKLLVEHIYKSYYSLMCASCAKHLSNKSDVEDVVHDAFLKIIDNLDTLETHDEKRLRAYCVVVARHKAIDYQRRKSNLDLPIEEIVYEEDTKFDVSEIVISNEGVSAIKRNIDSLPETYKNVCMLKYVCEMTNAEIASSLDLTVTTVSVRLTRARKMLCESLRKEGLLV